MDPSTPPPQKKGFGPLAWVGIGCGGIAVLGVIALVVFSVMFAPKFKKLADDMQKNPTRATAELMANASVGTMEIVAEDDPHLRYTLKQKQNGQLITIYWSEKSKKPETVSGDFSTIPADAAAPSAPVPK